VTTACPPCSKLPVPVARRLRTRRCGRHIPPNEASIVRLIGAVLLEQNDVYGPPPICKENHAATETGLAVVYPALSRGHIAAGPDWYSRIGDRTNGRARNGSHHFIGLCRTRSDRFAITSCHPADAAAPSEGVAVDNGAKG
jgi:hypothetical protein